jgi:hypothetical protein
MSEKQKRNKSSSWVILTTLAGAAGVWVIRRQRRRRRRLPQIREYRPRSAVERGPPPDKVRPEVEAPAEEAPPKPRPAVWQELEPTDATDPVPHEVPLLLEGVDGWQLAGASRRGKMHAHHGTYREDAFAMDVVGPWHLVAVSDGAGSARLSRVGSHVVVGAAIATLKEILTAEREPSPERLNQALEEALQAAHAAVHREAKEREQPVKEFSATFLLLVHGTAKDGHVIGSLQVGDGLIAIKYPDGTVEPLAERDSGAFGGETYFLTSKPAEAWLGRGEARRLEEPPEMLVAMSDGVADDFIPYEKHLPALFRNLDKIVAREEGYHDGDAAQVLLQLIGYDKRGSFDDRTLVMLYREAA